ncbi:MAG: hypothetical protein A3H27_05080 [Acidobacteria bacterium RIFCSPLOWO2_02_FULL_59_13]|nr:MAG: hypothetical protein A3H27_05080 [Acidobacteria bacterium RIFCSPLOWO2_02_FULL_59_13]
MNRPIRVILGSSAGVDGPPILSAFATIVRNLKILNSLPCRPTRTPRKNTGPGEFTLMSPAITRNTGHRNTIATADTTVSKARFKHL